MKITHNGSRLTSTYFRNKIGDTIKVTVWLSSDWVQAGTYYNYSISIKGFKCRKFNWILNSIHSTDDRYKQYISDQELYTAYHNHWNKLNPVRLFRSKQVNSDIIIGDDIDQLIADTKHKAY